MTRLIKLELERINLRPYFISSAIFGIVQLVLTYFVAYVAQAEQDCNAIHVHLHMLPIGIFALTEALSPIVSDVMTSDILITAFFGILVSLVAVSAIGLLSVSVKY